MFTVVVVLVTFISLVTFSLTLNFVCKTFEYMYMAKRDDTLTDKIKPVSL